MSRLELRHLGSIAIALTAILAAPAYAKSDRPVALVESIEGAPDAGLRAFDYVFENDKIDLRPNGRMVLAYFDSCAVETVTGGLVKIEEDGADVSKGGQSTIAMRKCDRARVALSDEAEEVGAAVKRVSPFEASIWRERALASARPIFKWQPPQNQTRATALRIYYLDADPIRLIWEGGTSDSYFELPAGDATLETGMPYRVEAILPDSNIVDAVFSIDPGLEVADDVMGRLVPLD